MMLARNHDHLSMHALHLLQHKIGGEIKDGKLLPIGPHLTALMPLQPASEFQRRWHVVQTEPRKEAEVAKAVEAVGFDAWCPKVPRKVRIRAEHYRPVHKPMIPGYVFASFDSAREAWEVIHGAKQIRGQRDTEGMRGVVRMLMIDLRPVPLGDREVERITLREAEEAAGRGAKYGGVYPLIVGAMVKVLTGPFAYFLGIVLEIDDRKNEVTAEMDIFSRKVPVTLECGQVEVI